MCVCFIQPEFRVSFEALEFPQCLCAVSNKLVNCFVRWLGMACSMYHEHFNDLDPSLWTTSRQKEWVLLAIEVKRMFFFVVHCHPSVFRQWLIMAGKGLVIWKKQPEWDDLEPLWLECERAVMAAYEDFIRCFVRWKQTNELADGEKASGTFCRLQAMPPILHKLGEKFEAYSGDLVKSCVRFHETFMSYLTLLFLV